MTDKSKINGLTKYKVGSLAEMLAISMPMILSSSSNAIMFNLDRVMLAKHSVEAFNGAAIASITSAIFMLAATAIALSAEIFTGQYNGARQYTKISEPVWQMIWFSLFSTFLFIPIGYFTVDLFIPAENSYSGSIYYKFMMYFGALDPLIAALAAFYIGIGKPSRITFAVILGSLINLLLNYILIYGVADLIPSMGAKGAAIATVSSKAFQVAYLFRYFYTNENKLKYHVNKICFQLKTIIDCIKVGSPVAISHIIEMSGWAFIFQVMAAVGSKELMFTSIAQSIYVLLAFVHYGLQKAVTALTANLIGAGLTRKVIKTLSSAITMQLGFGILMGFLFIGYPDFVKILFAPDNISSSNLSYLNEYLIILCNLTFVFLMLNALASIVSGILIAGGDTNFVMMVNSTNIWLFNAIPTYILIHYFKLDITLFLYNICLYAFMNLCCFSLRFLSNNWVKVDINKKEK